MAPNLQRIPGRQEHDLAMYSGLRNQSFSHCLLSAQTQVLNARPIGGVASAAVTAFTPLTLNNRNVPFSGTLVAQIVQASNTTGTIRLRIRGYDAFGVYQEELTPTVSIVAKTNNFVYCAKLWSYVVSVEFQSTGLDIAGDTISLGTRWDWTRTNDATNEHIAGRNLGIAIPRRLGRRPDPNVELQTWHQPAGFGGLRTDMLSANQFFDEFKPRVTRPRSYARADGTASAPPANNDTVTIDGVTYTWKTVLTPLANEVLIGASNITAVTNLAAAIIRDAALAGTSYGAATVAHPTVALGTSAYEFGNILIRAKAPGARGNLIAISEVSANFSWMNAATALVAGYDSPVELFGMAVYDVTGAGAAGALTHPQPTEYAIGWNEAGWEGPVEKFHFLRASSVAQWAVTDNVQVRFGVRTAEAA